MAKKPKNSSGEKLQEINEVELVEQADLAAPEVIEVYVVEEPKVTKVQLNFEVIDAPFAIEFLAHCVIFKASTSGRPEAIPYKKGACALVTSADAVQLDAQRIQYRKVG